MSKIEPQITAGSRKIEEKTRKIACAFIKDIIEEGEKQSDWSKGYGAMRLGLKPTPENKDKVILVSRIRRTKTMDALKELAQGRFLDKYYHYVTYSHPRYQYFFLKDNLEKLCSQEK